jgi:hypothetical protein
MSDPSLDTVAQSAHVWFAGWTVFVFHLWTNPWWGVLAVAIFAAIKEFLYDQKYESPAVRGSNWKDFGFYQVGSVLTALLLQAVKR